MITLYSGTPGAGKSLHVARKIYERLRITKRNVIATFPINMDVVSNKGKKKTANFIYCDITDISTSYLISYALEHHELGKENQTLVVIDECQIIYNPREFSRADRLKWIVFFTQHRKLGYDFILISQFDRLIDRQIRCLLEYNVIHRKANNLGMLWLFPIKFFVAVNVWYGAKVKCGQEFFLYRKKFGKMYDSFMMFDDSFKDFIHKNGDKVSQYNRKVLGIDKETSAPISEELPDGSEEPTVGTDEPIDEAAVIAEEIDRYSNTFEGMEGEEYSREAIEDEVNETIAIIEEGASDGIVTYVKHNRAACKAANTEITENAPASLHAVAGDKGVPAEAGGEAGAANGLLRIWRFLNKPISFEGGTSTTEQEPKG